MSHVFNVLGRGLLLILADERPILMVCAMQRVNADDEDAVEALRSVPEETMLEEIKECVSAGGDVNKQGAFGATCLHVAACNG